MTDCKKCNGNGWLIRDNKAFECRCRDPKRSKKALTRYLEIAGLLEDERLSALEPWSPEFQREPTDLLEWAIQCATEKPSIPSWTLYGENGRGKTKAAAMAVARFIKAGGEFALWLHVPAATKLAQDQRFNRAGGPLLDLRVKRACLVVIDELGAERGTDRSGIIEDWLLDLCRRQIPWIATTNAADVTQLGDGRIQSRIDLGEQLELVGPDVRGES